MHYYKQTLDLISYVSLHVRTLVTTCLRPAATVTLVLVLVSFWGLGAGVCHFDLNGIRLQCTNHAVGGNWYATFRIARACYVKVRDGMSKD